MSKSTRSVAIVLFLVIAAAGALPHLVATAAQPALAPEGQQWEYKTASLSRDLAGTKTGIARRGVGPGKVYAEIEKGLNKLGAEGWELCYAAEDLFVFKRRKSVP
jgi:hypothetical protein